MAECMSWNDMVRRIIEFPITRFQDKAYSDEEVKEIVSTMRKRMDDAAKNPDGDDPYETRSADYQDMYDTFQKMADMRGLVID